MKSKLAIAVLCLNLTPLAFASSDDMPQHFKGERAETLEQALKNLSTYNKKLEVMIGKGSLDNAEMAEVHQITYTLENALDRLEDELEIVEELLEDLHKASERSDYDKVTNQGRQYLDKIQIIVP
jgi:vacuolar-type H+-ATPase subunit I/STV1